MLGGLPYPPAGDLPNPGIEPASLKSLALADGFFTTSTTCKTTLTTLHCLYKLNRLSREGRKIETLGLPTGRG